ncbi:MAG: hypothetical protein QXZ59_00680 [Nitrososphaeria archaeon]
MSKEELTLERVVKVFEESWKELEKEYPDARMVSTFCSEADVELHFARKLLKKLPSNIVHIEFPIPLEVERLGRELFFGGRVSMKRCIKPDIVLIDPLVPEFFVIAELKFTPIYWAYMPLYLATEKELDKETVETLKEALKKDIHYFERVRQEEPTQAEIEKMYFGVDKRGQSKVEKLIAILNDFEIKEQQTVVGYLCVIDEIYPNIQEILRKTIKQYDPRGRFKVLAYHFPAYESLVKTLEKLE